MTSPAANSHRISGMRDRFAVALSRHGRWVGLACLLLAWPLSAAAPARVVVIADDSSLHREIITAATQRLRELGSTATLEIRDQGSPPAAESSPPSLLVTLGSDAARRHEITADALPLVHAALPEALFLSLQAQHESHDGHRHTALLLDQPPARQLRLLRLALPHFTRIGVLSSSGTEPLVERLRGAARAQGAELLVARVEEPRLLLTRLEELLHRADALLVTPDPALYNRVTLQNVLLASYRQRKPVIGLSAAYVKAGALLALHSEPADLGRDLGDLVSRLLADGPPRELPAPIHPQRFSVAVNMHVARALGLDRILPESRQLERMLREAERKP